MRALPPRHAVERPSGQSPARALDVPDVGWRAGRTRRTSRVGDPARPRASAASRRRSARLGRRPRSWRRRSASGSMMSPATARWVSTASRAISRCMISVDPSKIRLIRRSRRICSTGIAALAPRSQGVGRLVPAPAPDLDQLVGDPPGVLGGVELGQRGLDPDVGRRRHRPGGTTARARTRARSSSPPCRRSWWPRPRARGSACPTARALPTTRARLWCTTSSRRRKWPGSRAGRC